MSGFFQQASQWLGSLPGKLPDLPGRHRPSAETQGAPASPPASYLPAGSQPLPTPRAFRPLTRDQIEKGLPVKKIKDGVKFSITPDEIRKNALQEAVDQEGASFIDIPWDYNNLLDPFGH